MSDIATKISTNLVSVLRDLGVTHVFGIPGKSIVPLILAVNDGGLKFTLARQESGAGFMASGYALSSNTLGVVMGTSGPGGTNMLTAAAQAMAYNAPVLFITGAQAMLDTGKPISQDSSFYSVDLVDMFKSVTKFSAMVERAELFETYLRHALDEAFTGSKGAVHLSLPLDIQMEKIAPISYSIPSPSHGVVKSEILEAIEVLKASKRPAILAGKGVKLSKAYSEIVELAETFGIPVVTTPGGKGSFPSKHKYSIGPYGLGGCDEAREYLWSGVDLLVVLGSRLSDFSIPGFTPDMYPKHVLQFDINRKFVGRSLKVPTTFVSGDLRTNLRELLDNVNKSVRPLDLSFKQASYEVPQRESKTLYASEVICEINKITEKEDNSLLYADIGSHGFISVRYFDVKQQGSFIFDDYLACMGSAIGCAVGSKAGDPTKKVTCVTGDGCFFMLGTEVSTAVSSDLPVIFVVVNNSQLDMVTKGMTRDTGRWDGTTFDIPLDVSGMAKSLGALAYKCLDIETFSKAYSEAMTLDRTVVIEVVTDPEEPSPTVLRKLNYVRGD